MPTKQITSKDGLSKEFKYLLAGTSVNIDIITPVGKKGRFKTTFIGYLPEEYILIQFPESHKLGSFSQYIKQGLQITVRGLVEGHEASVIAFISSIKQTLSQPSNIMVLDFPKSMVIHNLRSTKRVLTDLPMKICTTPDHLSGTLTDVSLAGCQLELEQQKKGLDEGEEIVIEVAENEQETIRVKARICNVKPSDDGTALGCQFLNEQETEIEKIVHMALMAEQ